MTFSAKLGAAEKVTFHLRYEELLLREDSGLYLYQVNIQPKNQKIASFSIRVTIEESLPLKEISVWRKKDLNQAKPKTDDITHQSLTHDSKNSPKYAYIDINRNNAQNNGKDWKFQVQYDVQRLAYFNMLYVFGLLSNTNSSHKETLNYLLT